MPGYLTNYSGGGGISLSDVTYQNAYNGGRQVYQEEDGHVVYINNYTNPSKQQAGIILKTETESSSGNTPHYWPYIQFSGTEYYGGANEEISYRMTLAGIFGEWALAFGCKSQGASDFANLWGITQTGKLASINDWQYGAEPQVGFVQSTTTAATALAPVQVPPLSAFFGNAWDGSQSIGGFFGQVMFPIEGTGSINTSMIFIGVPDAETPIFLVTMSDTDDPTLEIAGNVGIASDALPSSYAANGAWALGATTDTAFECINTTEAESGAQQWSPARVLGGQGWKTNATAESQEVLFQDYLVPVEGAANPTGKWVAAFNINGAGYSTAAELYSSGLFRASGSLRAAGDSGGEASTVTLTNATAAADSNSVSHIATPTGVSGTQAGWLKIYVAGTASYVPFFQ